MIEFTIKTLDSFNHHFTVEDETTVSQLKERIRDELGIEITMQRLIFCGRVMQDHHRLTEYDVDGKVIHLVQRAPPSPQRRAASAQREREQDLEPEWDDEREIERERSNQGSPELFTVSSSMPNDMAPPHVVPWMTPTSGRLDFIRRTIQDIRDGVTHLRAEVLSWENGDRAEVPVEPMETETANTATTNSAPNEGEGVEDEHEADIMARALNARRRNRGARANRRYTRPRDLGQLIEELDSLFDEFAPYRATYARMLRMTHFDYSNAERAHRQRVVGLVCDVLHSFAHVFHAVSDITLHVGQRYPRLASDPPLRHPMPMQAHINVMQSNRRSTQQQGNNDTQNSTSTTTETGPGSGAATATPAANATNPPATENNQTNQGIRIIQNNVTLGRNTTQSNFNMQPEPVTYQVEIETRVPIAVPLDNIILNGLAAVANSIHNEHIRNSQQGQGQTVGQNVGQQTAAGQTAGQAPAQGQAQPQPTRLGQSQQGQGQGQTQNQGQANRTRALLDIENLLHGLSQGNGVELVMNPGEQQNLPPHFSGIHMPQPIIPPADTNIYYSGESGVIVTPVFASSPAPTAEILQNVLSNVLRPNLGEGTPFFFPAQALMRQPIHHQMQMGRQGQAQNTGQAQGVQIPPPTGHPGVQIPTVVTIGQPQTFIGQVQGLIGQAQGLSRQTQAAGGQTQAHGGQTQAAGGQTQAPGGQTQVPGGQTQVPGGQTQAAGGQTQPTTGQAGGQTLGTGDSNTTQQPGGQIPTTGPNQAGNQNQQARNPNYRPVLDVGPFGHVLRNRYPYPITCMVYDRYMHCDSVYARRHLIRRREEFQMINEAEAQERASRAPLPDIDTLRDRNPHFTERHMAIMMRLLSGPVSLEGGLNAFMVTVARHIFFMLRTNDSPPIPTEFASIREQLRHYVSNLLEHAIERSTRTNPFEAVTERIITQFSDFLDNLPNLTRMNRNVDPTTTVRVMIRSRLPAIIACVMSESSSEMFADRFYNVFARFFTDLCTIFQHFFPCGFNALLMVYDMFLERVTEGFEETAREWIRLLSRENLIAIRYNLEPNLTSVRQYFRRADGSMLPTTVAEQQDIPLEVSAHMPHICERHQRMTMPLQAPPLLPPPGRYTSNYTTTRISGPFSYRPTPHPQPPHPPPSSQPPQPTQTTRPERSAQPTQPEQPDRPTQPEKPDQSTQPESEQPSETQDDLSQSDGDLESEDLPSGDEPSTAPVTPIKERLVTGESSSSTMSPYDYESRSPKELRSQGTSPIHVTYTYAPQDGEGSAAAALPQEPSETSETSETSPRDTPDSMRIVPPVILLQHWGEEWVPVFTRDQRAQRERENDPPPEPFSDGYLAGMPSRKRRCVRQSRPPTTLDGLMTESINEATGRTTTTVDQQELRGVFRESVRTMVRNRASNSEDYDPVRYSSTARFMDQPKANDSEKKSKSQDSMD